MWRVGRIFLALFPAPKVWQRVAKKMPGNRFNGFTDYGIGIGLRAPHYEHILSRKPVVDWFEIISENFMIHGGRPLHILDQILDEALKDNRFLTEMQLELAV
jgi:hypothetical protein